MRTVIITGVSSGVGKATAQAYRHQGDSVFGFARHATSQAELSAIGVQLIDVDLTDELQVQTAVAQVLQVSPMIDVLVNVAGMAVNGALEDLPLEKGIQQFDVNVFGVSRLIQAIIPSMRHQRKGQIIIVSSIASQSVQPLMGWYAASKAAIEQLAYSLQSEVAQFGIRVSVVRPSTIDTRMTQGTPSYLIYSGTTSYGKLATAFSQAMAAGKQHVITPQKVAQLLLKISQQARPKLIYRIGYGTTLLTVLNHILPTDWYRRLMALPYRKLS